MDKISTWLIILFLKEYNASWAILCPSVGSWETRSWLYCKENPLWYHCLNDLEGEIIEICLKPTYIAKGYYPVLSKEHSSILSTECPRTLYQPFGQMSNEFRKRTCAYTKSLCNGLGEETCKEGSSREDRSCRCRHTDGYVSIESLQTLTNKSCYRPKYETNGCSYFTCPEDKELNPWYACVKKCPFGYHRRKYESSCVANTSSEFLSSETEVYGSTGRILHTSPATQKIHVTVDIDTIVNQRFASVDNGFLRGVNFNCYSPKQASFLCCYSTSEYNQLAVAFLFMLPLSCFIFSVF